MGLSGCGFVWPVLFVVGVVDRLLSPSKSLLVLSGFGLSLRRLLRGVAVCWPVLAVVSRLLCWRLSSVSRLLCWRLSSVSSASASKNTASRTAKLLEEKQVVTVRRIEGCTNEYQFCRKVLKFLKRTVAKRTRPLLPKRPALRNFRGKLSQLRTKRALKRAKERDERERKAWEKANPKQAAILKEIKELGKATGNHFQAFLDNCHRLKTA